MYKQLEYIHMTPQDMEAVDDALVACTFSAEAQLAQEVRKTKTSMDTPDNPDKWRVEKLAVELMRLLKELDEWRGTYGGLYGACNITDKGEHDDE